MSIFEEKNIAQITSLPDAKRREFIEKMAPVQVMELSLAFPWEQRLRILEESPAFQDLVNSYPIQELYWTIKAVGPRDSLSALRALAPERIQFFFDLEWWKKDRFIPNRALAWIILLFEASEDKVIEWATFVHRIDEALLPLLLRHFIKVIKRPDDMEIQEARDTLAPFTLDDIYYIEFKNLELQPVWGRFLALLFSTRPEIYRDVMESILWETMLEEMENAYRWRVARLSDQGIPEYFEAIDIFAHMPKPSWRKVGDHEMGLLGNGKDVPISFVPTLYIEGANTLTHALSRLKGTQFMERIIHEWIGVANKIIVAKGVDVDEPKMLLDALIEASSLINLGLECVTRESGEAPFDVLKYAVIEDLVRVGVSAAKDARRPVFEFSKRPEVSHELFELPDGLRERVVAALGEPPRAWDNVHYGSRPLVGVKDIEGIREDARKVNDLVSIMEGIEPHWSVWDKMVSVEGTNIHDIRELDLLTGLVTALGNFMLKGKAEVSPIDERELGELFSLWDKGSLVEEKLWEVSRISGVAPSKAFSHMVNERVQALLDDWRTQGRPNAVDGLFVTGLFVRLGSYRA